MNSFREGFFSIYAVNYIPFNGLPPNNGQFLGDLGVRYFECRLYYSCLAGWLYAITDIFIWLPNIFQWTLYHGITLYVNYTTYLHYLSVTLYFFSTLYDVLGIGTDFYPSYPSPHHHQWPLNPTIAAAANTAIPAAANTAVTAAVHSLQPITSSNPSHLTSPNLTSHHFKH